MKKINFYTFSGGGGFVAIWLHCQKLTKPGNKLAIIAIKVTLQNFHNVVACSSFIIQFLGLQYPETKHVENAKNLSKNMELFIDNKPNHRNRSTYETIFEYGN